LTNILDVVAINCVIKRCTKGILHITRTSCHSCSLTYSLTHYTVVNGPSLLPKNYVYLTCNIVEASKKIIFHFKHEQWTKRCASLKGCVLEHTLMCFLLPTHLILAFNDFSYAHFFQYHVSQWKPTCVFTMLDHCFCF
jgi:hypothetical protein